MAEVRLRCDIDGCGASWLVKPAQMKKSMADHRVKFHPDWVQPVPKTASAYRLDYSSRARRF